MTIRKTVTLVEEINSEYGAPASPPAATRRHCRGVREPARRQGSPRRPQASDRLFARTRGVAHQDGAGNAWRESGRAARLYQGGAGRHRRRPRAWRGDDPSETGHGDAPRDQTRSRHHSGPRQGGPAGHDRRSDLWAPRRRLGSRCLRFDPGADPRRAATRTKSCCGSVTPPVRASMPAARVRIRRRSMPSSRPSPAAREATPASAFRVLTAGRI